MSSESYLESGREAYLRQRWPEARERLMAADAEAPLGPEDLERLAAAATLCGEREAGLEAWTRAHNEYLRRGEAADAARAGRCAGWLAFRLMVTGEPARAGGWLSRAARLLEACPAECVERGYLVLPLAMRSALAGDAAAARAGFRQATQIGERYGDCDLAAMGRMGEGRSLLRLGEVAEGLALLDEAMIACETRDVSPVLIGDLYCSVITACGEVFDLRRAQEWTAALGRWCDAQPAMAPHRGECLVHRAEILRLHGAWPDALQEAGRACDEASEPPTRDPAVGAAFYQRAELHRLRGEQELAELDYRCASRWGRNPQPGLALLRLAQGQVEVALAAIRRAAEEARERVTRSAVLAAAVEIALAAGDVAGARASADELACIAATLAATYLRALSTGALGAVLLAEGEPRAALDCLAEAGAAWQELEAPYEGARVRVLRAQACGALGDDDARTLELEGARASFAQLGAAPDLDRLQSLAAEASPALEPEAPDGLTARELEVLRLVAAGETNRAIARTLFISEKTVARHVSNIFGKLGLSTRAAAASYAYRHQLVGQGA